ncbi:hypothetical protein D7Y15_35715 [Corallococcus sp. AB030]|nr:hypothetical protein D7Y15_35715 [Corallococcus sp. AB030]
MWDESGVARARAEDEMIFSRMFCSDRWWRNESLSGECSDESNVFVVERRSAQILAFRYDLKGVALVFFD